jgi:hypothetical protein
VVESSALLKRRRVKPTEGSNPSLSATFPSERLMNTGFQRLRWPLFHSCHSPPFSRQNGEKCLFYWHSIGTRRRSIPALGRAVVFALVDQLPLPVRHGLGIRLTAKPRRAATANTPRANLNPDAPAISPPHQPRAVTTRQAECDHPPRRRSELLRRVQPQAQRLTTHRAFCVRQVAPR